MDPNEQIKILIVEDEIAVRRSLKGKIKRYEQEIFSIDEAKNAEEAYEKISISLPHIIFLDMKMPGMGGMAFLEILHAEFPKIKVIVLSGYSDFKYVQKALKCGAVDYLLKPVIKEELYKEINKIVEKIRQENRKLQHEVKTHQLLKRSTALLKDNLMNDLLYSDKNQFSDIIKKLLMLGIEFNDDQYFLVTSKIINGNEVKSYFSDDESMLFFGLENVLLDTLTSYPIIVSFRSKKNEYELISLIGVPEPVFSRENLKEGSRSVIKNTANIFPNMKLKMIHSEPFKDLKDMYVHYRKSVSVSQKETSDKDVLFVEDIYQQETSTSLEKIWSEERDQRFYQLLKDQDLKLITEFIQDSFSRLDSEEKDSFVSKVALVSSMFEVFINYCMKTKSLSKEQLPSLSEFLRKHEENLRLGLISVICKPFSEKEKSSLKESKKIVKEIQDYLHSSYYDSDISLEGLAQQYYINRSYLSEIFKMEVGVPFKKYLVQIRIEKAMELLSEQIMKVSDVAYLVGFNDPDYFGSVFKKQTGMTVREFSERKMTDQSA